MSDEKRRLLILTVTVLALAAVLLFFGNEQKFEPEAKEYYRENYISDTGAKNAVAAIYLNYRVFDTFFEALLLIISVAGIIYFLEEKRNDNT